MKNPSIISFRMTSCLAYAFVFLALSSASASTFYVAKGGSDYPTCGTKKVTACSTIQYTISNRSVSGDLILIEPGIYPELITVDRNLTLRGSFLGQVIIDGKRNGTVVTIAGVSVTLDSLIIRNGLVTTNDLSFVGGGINNMGALTLVESVVTGNNVNTPDQSFAPLAGGILNQGSLNISFSSIDLNSAAGGCATAGGILNFNGSVTMDHSLVAGNTLSSGSGCVGPGTVPDASGYFNLQGNSVIHTSTFWKNEISTVGTFTLDSSTISNSDGNGIINCGQLTVVNSTITGSTGAGISNFLAELVGTLDLSNSTIANNGGYGVDFGAPLESTMRNSILSGNGGGDCNSDFLSGDYNLIQNISGCGFVDGGHDITGVSPDLNKLGFYGGLTQTMTLQSNSPAINAGNPAGCKDSSGNLLTTDQRGFPRPEPRGGRCDIGAVEMQRVGRFLY
jgi:hypothetical protein